MAEQECPKCPPEGLPAWMGTFADLMSLLMCFFVTLLTIVCSERLLNILISTDFAVVLIKFHGCWLSLAKMFSH